MKTSARGPAVLLALILAAGSEPAARPQEPTRVTTPWGRQKAGAWFRYRTLAGVEESYTDTGLKERDAGFVVLYQQIHRKGASEPVAEIRQDNPTYTVKGTESVAVEGRAYTCEILSSPDGLKAWSIRDGRYAGAILKSESAKASFAPKRVWEHEITVKGKIFNCLVVEGDETAGGAAQPLKTWYCDAFPAGFLKQESPLRTVSLVDYGTDWAQRPAAPATAAAKPVAPPTPAPAPAKAAPVQEDAAARVKKALDEAGRRVREATPLYQEVASADPLPTGADALKALDEKASKVESLLAAARKIYADNKAAAPNPDAVGDRIDAIDELIGTIREKSGQVKVALAPPKPTPPKPEPAKPEPAKPEAAKVEPPKPAPPKPEPAKPEVAKVEPPKPVPAKPEPAKPEVAKVEPPKPVPPKPEPAKPEVAKVDPPKPEPAKPAPPQDPAAQAKKALDEAARLLREATPLYQEVSGVDPLPADPDKLKALEAKATKSAEILTAARKLYADNKAAAPDPDAVAQRIEIIDELQASMKEKLAQIVAAKPAPAKPVPPQPAPPKPEVAKVEPPKPAPAQPEPPKPEPVKPAPVQPEVAKPEPVKPAQEDPATVAKKAIDDAGKMIREATPLYQEVIEAEPLPSEPDKLKALEEKASKAEGLLEGARKLYAAHQGAAVNPEAVAQRIEILNELLGTVRGKRDAIKGGLAAKPEPPKPDPAPVDPAKPDPVKPEPAKTEPAAVAPRQEAPELEPYMRLDDPAAGRFIDFDWLELQARLGLAVFSEDYHIDPSPAISFMAHAPLPWLSPGSDPGGEYFGILLELTLLPSIERDLDPEPDQASGTCFFIGGGLDFTLLRNQSLYFTLQGGFQYGSYGGITGLSDGFASMAGGSLGIYMGKSVTVTVNGEGIFGHAGDYLAIGTLGLLIEF